MRVQHNKVIVVDDNEMEGHDIVKALWNGQVPVHFFKYDEPALMALSGQNTVKHCGVRAVVMDINLSGTGVVGKSNYDAAVKTINTLISSENGPWVLITWSSHNDKSDELYERLREKLPEKLRPIAKKSLDKKNFQNGNSHDGITLDQHISSILNSYEALNMLIVWEADIQRKLSSVIGSIAEVAHSENISDFDGNLAWLLDVLAKKESNDGASAPELRSAFYEILANLIKDKIDSSPSQSQWINKTNIKAPATKKRLVLWGRRINTILHLDIGGQFNGQYPGSIFEYPKNTKNHPAPKYTNEKYDEITLDQFFKSSGWDEAYKSTILGACKLYLMDITPRCDHAQKNVVLRRFVFMLCVPRKYKEKVHSQSKYLKSTPEFIKNDISIIDKNTNEDEGFLYFINSRMIFSIKEDDSKKLSRFFQGRLKEQILSDIQNWLGGQTSRLGITSVDIKK